MYVVPGSYISYYSIFKVFTIPCFDILEKTNGTKKWSLFEETAYAHIVTGECTWSLSLTLTLSFSYPSENYIFAQTYLHLLCHQPWHKFLLSCYRLVWWVYFAFSLHPSTPYTNLQQLWLFPAKKRGASPMLLTELSTKVLRMSDTEQESSSCSSQDTGECFQMFVYTKICVLCP